VPLSEHEQRILAELEDSLVRQDPEFAERVRSETVYRHAGRYCKWAAVGFVAGVAVLVGFYSESLILGFIGVAMMERVKQLKHDYLFGSVHAILGAADALGEPLAALLGDPAYYRRFGFELSSVYQITPPVPHWQPHFQVRVLSAYHPRLRGPFTYPEPFDRT